jgi:hypothetical protein
MHVGLRREDDRDKLYCANHLVARLYGVTCVLTLSYFQAHAKADKWWLKILVGVLIWGIPIADL